MKHWIGSFCSLKCPLHETESLGYDYASNCLFHLFESGSGVYHLNVPPMVVLYDLFQIAQASIPPNPIGHKEVMSIIIFCLQDLENIPQHIGELAPGRLISLCFNDDLGLFS